MKLIKYIGAVVLLLSMTTSCSEDKYGEHSEIVYPIPVVSSVTADVGVGEEIVIVGKNFVEPNSVMIDGISMEIVSQEAEKIVAVLPRLFDASSVVVYNAYGRQSEEEMIVRPIYPSASEISVTSWPKEIVKGRPLIIRGTNMDMVTEAIIGSTTISVNGLTQQRERLLVLVPETLEGTEATITLRTIVGSTIALEETRNIVEYDPVNWEPISPVILMDFEDGNMHYVSGDMPSNLCRASLNGAGNGIESKDGANYFSLYAKDITGSYSMWSFLGSLKMEFVSPIDVSEFHDPYITFYWNSDDNIGSFQLSVSQGEAIGGSTFSPGKTDKTYDPDAKYDLYTLRPTNKQWHCITARLKDLVVENWGGDFKEFDLYGQITAVELIFKQINGVYWNGLYGTDSPEGIYDYSVQGNTEFKANIDKIMITDGPYTFDGYPERQ